MKSILIFLGIILFSFFIGVIIETVVSKLLKKVAIHEVILKSLSRIPLVSFPLIGAYIGLPYLSLNAKLSYLVNNLIIFSLIMLVFVFISRLSVYLVEG